MTGPLVFAYTVVYVTDVPATVDFYSAALGLPLQFMHETRRYAEMSTGATTLAFTESDLAASVLPNLKQGFTPNSPNESPAAFDVAFSTDNPDEFFVRAVAAGAVIVAPIQMKDWGQQVGYLRDINGVLIEIGTPVDQTHTTGLHQPE